MNTEFRNELKELSYNELLTVKAEASEQEPNLVSTVELELVQREARVADSQDAALGFRHCPVS